MLIKKKNIGEKKVILLCSMGILLMFMNGKEAYSQSLNYSFQKNDLFQSYEFFSKDNQKYNSALVSLESLSKEKFNMSAVSVEVREIKLNEGLASNSISNINQNQINYSLLAIEDMQLDVGSGIYVKQNKYSYSSIDEYRLGVNKNTSLSSFGDASYEQIKANQKYNNTISGKFAINAEDSLMASFNEGQNGLEQINYFGGLLNKGETKTLGLSLAYNKKINEHNIFAFIGKNWIENSFTNTNLIQGEQTVIGIGVNYKTNIDEITLIPQLNIQSIKSGLRINNIDNNYNQTVATLGVKTNYKIDRKMSFNAGINLEKDLSVDGNMLLANINNSSFYNKERLDVELSMAYKPVDQMSLMFGVKHGVGKTFNDNAVKVGIKYSF